MGTSIDILSAGPSAKDYEATGRKVVGVNRAGTIYPCDYLVLLDFAGYEEYKDRIKGNPILVTCGNCSSKFNKRNIDHHVTGYCRIPKEYKTTEFSFVAARYFAEMELEATEINVYGDDKHGTSDCSHYKEANRSLNRWEKEIYAELLLMRYIQMVKEIK